jgi:hypothetical protein
VTDGEIKRPIDPIGLLFGLAAMCASAFILTDGAFSFDPRWALATIAVVVGLGLLANSVRRRRH